MIRRRLLHHSVTSGWHALIAIILFVLFGVSASYLILRSLGLDGAPDAAVVAKPQLPAATSVPAPLMPLTPIAVPPDTAAAGRMWFDPCGPSTEPGFWRRSPDGSAWDWSPLSADASAMSAIEEQVFAGQGGLPHPPWPSSAGQLQIKRVRDTGGRDLGYWVWNAASFVMLPSGSHQWTPHWEWTPAGTPLLLVPEEFPLEWEEMWRI
jgi:hypothetical protein